MGDKSDNQPAALADDLHKYEELSSPISPQEISRIRDFAEHYQESKGIAWLRELANQKKDTTVLDRIRDMAVHYSSALRVAPDAGKIKASLDSAQDVELLLYELNPSAKVLSFEDRLIRIEAEAHDKIPILDPPYALKGGAARLMMNALTGEKVKNKTPRDLDLVRIGAGSPQEDDRMAKLYMPDDLQYGNGVELIDDIAQYMQSRDLTINQVLLYDQQLICTPQALRDSINGVLRPTEHVLGKDNLPPGRIVMKMVRMKSVAAIEHKNFQIAAIPEDTRITPFDIALHLDRTMARSVTAAEHYIAECVARNYLPAKEFSSLDIKAAITALGNKLREGPDFFSNYTEPGKIRPGALGRSPGKRK